MLTELVGLLGLFAPYETEVARLLGQAVPGFIFCSG